MVEKTMMLGKPVTAVWEITMGCNMRCKHCGSGCSTALPGQLSTEEALKVCDELGAMGLQWVTISGGEPTTRDDWPLIAARLHKNGVIPNMITNGWLFDEGILELAIHAGVGTIAFSVDGLKETHDFIRREGSFVRIMQAMELCRSREIDVKAITTINKMNLGELKELKKQLVLRGVKGWQVQMGFPMGNMANHSGMVIEPGDIDTVIDLAYQCMVESSIEVILGDCLGYFNLKEIELFKKRCGGTYSRQGCTAGKYTFGILHNGDILGCTSIRDKEFIEGNIRQTPLKDIWENPNHFSWNRNMKKESLAGFCQKCRFGDRCLGGCSNSKLTIGGSVYAENQYCSYNYANKKRIKQYEHIKTEDLIAMARKFAAKGYCQLAETALFVVLQRAGTESNVNLLNLYGYVSFRLGNYHVALKANDKVLQLEPNEVYALKGKGLCLSRLGSPEEGIALLRKAVSLTDENFMDPYLDLAIVLSENGHQEEAISVIEQGRQRSQQFVAQSQKLYQQLKGLG
ncbi:radical SAM/SPASM domain-containing protein [Desulfotomaculum sp. 1211_IL3151]|uniref:radical SAM/SPASM domain-containing protein n=1 Tax=Desulfotomaculum sp. 1211_IL3151 TaxID=3084055 RepID=UPI002FDAE75E